MTEEVQKLGNPERNIYYFHNHITVFCFSTDDEPDSVFLHVSPPDEEQGL
jgi:hypothetical protein